MDLAIPWNIPALAPEYSLFPLSFSDSLALLLATENKQVGIGRLSKSMYYIVFNLTLKRNIGPSFGFIIQLSNYLWYSYCFCFEFVFGIYVQLFWDIDLVIAAAWRAYAPIK